MINAAFSPSESISLLCAYHLTTISLCSGKRPCTAKNQKLFQQGKLKVNVTWINSNNIHLMYSPEGNS